MPWGAGGEAAAQEVATPSSAAVSQAARLIAVASAFLERRRGEGAIPGARGVDCDRAIAAEPQPLLAEPAYRLRIDAMLFCKNAGSKPFLGVVGLHRYRGLHDDRPAVESGRDEVHRAAVNAHAGLESPPVRIETLESGKQGRVDIHDPAIVAFDEGRRQNTHE